MCTLPSLVPGSRPAFRRLQYRNAGEGLGHRPGIFSHVSNFAQLRISYKEEDHDVIRMKKQSFTYCSTNYTCSTLGVNNSRPLLAGYAW